MRGMSPEKFKEECGLMGIFSHPQAAYLTYLGLYAQQHRGEEGCGIVAVTEEKDFIVKKGLGIVSHVFRKKHLEELKPARTSIGHVRYSTKGFNDIENVQPLVSPKRSWSLRKKSSSQKENQDISMLALAHNGNLVNSSVLRDELVKKGSEFQGTNDTENLIELLKQGSSLKESLNLLEGAFCFLILTDTSLIAVRDAYGFRPLVLGELDGSYVVASETCAFDLVGAKFIREIQPGEVVEITAQGMSSYFFKSQKKKAFCSFEHIYFSRPDSQVFGLSVYEVRKKTGRILARETGVKGADFVMPVPDSGIVASLGYSSESGLPLELGLIRNHYVGRTFIKPDQVMRQSDLKIKLNPQACVLKGKKVVVIDDSLVRGTTSQKVVSLIRQAGALEVHLRIAAPPSTGPCFYGVDTPFKKDLIASHKSTKEICEIIGADSLAYLSEEGLCEATGTSLKGSSYCRACFNGNYPTDLFGASV